MLTQTFSDIRHEEITSAIQKATSAEQIETVIRSAAKSGSTEGGLIILAKIAPDHPSLIALRKKIENEFPQVRGLSIEDSVFGTRLRLDFSNPGQTSIQKPIWGSILGLQ